MTPTPSEPFTEPFIEHGDEPRSFASPDGSLTRLEEEGVGRESREARKNGAASPSVANPPPRNLPPAEDMLAKFLELRKTLGTT